MRLPHRLLLPLALSWAVAVGPAHAQTGAAEPARSTAPDYRVEVLVFANRDFDANEEIFTHGREAPVAGDLSDVSLPPPESARLALQPIAPIPAAEPPGPPLGPGVGSEPGSIEMPRAIPVGREPPVIRRLLQPHELELGNTYRSLERIAAYAPLLHGGWVQAGLPQAQAVPVDLAQFGIANLRGEVELYLSRFLHIDVDVSYQPDAGVAAPAGLSRLGEFELAPRYALQGERRLRSGELHYFDHPAFGVLVIVKPMPQPEPLAGSGQPAA
jgi:hypothetical protein